jgi:hypothetical protein
MAEIRLNRSGIGLGGGSVRFRPQADTELDLDTYILNGCFRESRPLGHADQGVNVNTERPKAKLSPGPPRLKLRLGSM